MARRRRGEGVQDNQGAWQAGCPLPGELFLRQKEPSAGCCDFGLVVRQPAHAGLASKALPCCFDTPAFRHGVACQHGDVTFMAAFPSVCRGVRPAGPDVHLLLPHATERHGDAGKCQLCHRLYKFSLASHCARLRAWHGEQDCGWSCFQEHVLSTRGWFLSWQSWPSFCSQSPSYCTPQPGRQKPTAFCIVVDTKQQGTHP